MRFEWDAAKNEINRRKHGIDFDTAKYAFYDPLARSVLDREIGGEQRWQTTGRVGGKLLLLVVNTIRDEEADVVIRIISARKTTRSERRSYEEEGD
jgi:uncharacterized DUF497 family protein